MSNKKKFAIGAAITGAVIGAAILIKKKGLPSLGPGYPPAAQPELLLFGGDGHKVFLGCLNCNEFEPGSVLNKYGDHGSPYQEASIFNRYGEFGSAYSAHSACNSYATDPPIIVDQQGVAYGRLTLNRFAYQVNSPETIAWLQGVCQSR